MVWYEFFESFTNSVHLKPISNVEKFRYLRQHLKDEALSTLNALPITNDNCDKAINLLTHRYGQPQRRIRAHVRELINCVGADFRDRKSILKFVDRVRLHMSGLEQWFANLFCLGPTDI